MENRNKNKLWLITAMIVFIGFIVSTCDDGANLSSGGGCTHEWNVFVQTINPTCTTAGVKTRTCKNCSAVDAVTETGAPALGHEWEYTEGSILPTCLLDGYGTVRCKRDGCDYIITDNIIEKRNHHFVEHWEVIDASTCIAAGLEERFCTHDCGEIGNRETRIINSLGHNWNDWITQTEPTETEPGEETRACQRADCNSTENRLTSPTASTPGLGFHLMWGDTYAVSKGTATASVIVIPATYNGLPVTCIDYYGFEDYTMMTNIFIPDSVTTVQYSAFRGCTNLENITIPFSVTSIFVDFALFDGCESLKSINVDSNNPNYLSRDGILYDKPVTQILYIPKLISGNISIPNGVEIIGDNAFVRYGIQSIVIPDSVTTINAYAFRECTSLENVTMGNNVASIDSGAFFDCSSLTSITIPNSVTSIGYSAFSGCTSLESITIPASVTSIGDSAFLGCINLSVTWYYNPSFNANIFRTNYYNDITILKTVIIPTSVTSISDNAFDNCINLESIIIPNSVTSIGNGAFSGCSSLESITIPDSVTSIGYSAFQDCTNLSVTWNYNPAFNANVFRTNYSNEITGLKTVIIPNGVTNIGDSAFFYCTGLTNIIIPASITSIGDSAFLGCTNLSVTWNYNPAYTANVFKTDNYNTQISILKTVIIPNGVTNISDNAFYNCINLESITIPNSVTSIGDFTFYGCSSLESITIPNSVTSIGDYTFYGCSSLKSIIIPDNVTSIGIVAFRDCTNLTSVTIPASMATIGSRAFQNCSNLSIVTILRTTPPTLPSTTSEFNNTTVFSNVSYVGGYNYYTILPKLRIEVPDSSLTAYKNSSTWNHYASYIYAITE